MLPIDSWPRAATNVHYYNQYHSNFGQPTALRHGSVTQSRNCEVKFSAWMLYDFCFEGVIKNHACNTSVPYLHDSNTHVFLLNLGLKFVCALQSYWKVKSASWRNPTQPNPEQSTNITWVNFGITKMSSKIKRILTGAWHKWFCFYICAVESTANYIFEYPQVN